MAATSHTARALTLAATVASLLPLASHAQSWTRPGEETMNFNLGGVTSRIDASARLDGNRGGTGIDLEGDTGLDSNRSTFSLGASLRFAPKHRFDALYGAFSRSASKRIDREFVIDDVVIPVNTVLSTESDSKLGFLGYRYSFLKSPSSEFAAGLGMYGGNFKFKFNADAPKVSIDESTTLPLPVLSLTGDFYLTERMILRANVNGLKLKVNDVDGSVLAAGVASEYLFTNNFGLGLGLDYFDLEVDAVKNGFKGNAQFKSSKATLYLTGRF